MSGRREKEERGKEGRKQGREREGGREGRRERGREGGREREREPVIFPVMCSLCLIGFDAADVVRSALHEFPYQLIGLGLGPDTHTHM